MSAPPDLAERPTDRSVSLRAPWPRSTRTTCQPRSSSPSRRWRKLQRRRIPRFARKCLFRRRPLQVGRGRVQGCAVDLFEPAAGRPEARSGGDCAGQERRSAVLPRGGPRRARCFRLRSGRGSRGSAGTCDRRSPERCSSAGRRRSCPPEPGARLRTRGRLDEREDGRRAGHSGRSARCPHPSVDADRHAWKQSTASRCAYRSHSGRGGSGPADALGAEQDEHADGSVCSSAGSQLRRPCRSSRSPRRSRRRHRLPLRPRRRRSSLRQPLRLRAPMPFVNVPARKSAKTAAVPAKKPSAAPVKSAEMRNASAREEGVFQSARPP